MDDHIKVEDITDVPRCAPASPRSPLRDAWFLVRAFRSGNRYYRDRHTGEVCVTQNELGPGYDQQHRLLDRRGILPVEAPYGTRASWLIPLKDTRGNSINVPLYPSAAEALWVAHTFGMPVNAKQDAVDADDIENSYQLLTHGR